AAMGGLWPGLLASVLGAVAGLSITWGARIDGDFAGAAAFLGIGLIIAAGGEMFQRMRTQAAAVSDDLRCPEAHLGAILAAVPDALVVSDDRGVMRSFSLAAERLFGWSAAEAIGRNVSLLMPAPYRDAHDDYLDRYLETGERRIIGIG